MVSSALTENVEAAGALPAPKKVRIIDMSAGSTVMSDETKWYNRVPDPPVQKNAAKAQTTQAEARAEKPRKKRSVQRAAPRQDAYSAYASESTRERQGFGFFNWKRRDLDGEEAAKDHQRGEEEKQRAKDAELLLRANIQVSAAN